MRVRTVPEIEWWKIPRDGLVLELMMQEGSGDKVYDTSGNGNHGTLYGGVWQRLSSGKWILSFDGIDDYSDFSNRSEFNLTNAITISVWVKPLGIGSEFEYVIYKYSSYFLRSVLDWNYGFAFFININGGYEPQVQYMYGENGVGKWYHVVATYDSNEGKLRLYVNGILRDEQSRTGNIEISDYPLYFGCDSFGRAYLKGHIGHVMIYNRALSKTEIANIYNATRKWFV